MYRLTFESHGVIAEAASDDESLFEGLASMLPPGWRAASGTPQASIAVLRDGLLTIDGEEIARTPGEREAMLLSFGSAVQYRIALLARRHVFFHAGVVGVGDRAIVIPGVSHSGKTTLVHALLQEGATYFSDEYAVVDSDGLIHPYARPLSLRDGSSGLGSPVGVPESQVGRSPIRAGLILLTRFEQGAVWRPTELSAGEGAMHLLQNAVAEPSEAGRILPAVGLLVRDARVLTGPRGEASAVAPALVAGEFDYPRSAR